MHAAHPCRRRSFRKRHRDQRPGSSHRKFVLIYLPASQSRNMAEAKSKCHCSVPQCKTNKQRQPYLTFHGFPGDRNERKKWFEAIRRDEGQNLTILRGSTFVCSLHFSEGDFIPTTGRKRLKNGAVPSRFHWNNWGLGHRDPVCEKEPAPVQDAPPEPPRKKSLCEDISPAVTLTFGPDHDYAAAPTPGVFMCPAEGFRVFKALKCLKSNDINTVNMYLNVKEM